LGDWVLVIGLLYLLIQGLHEYFLIVQEKQKSYTILGYLIGSAFILVAYLSPENIAVVIGLGALGFIFVRIIGPEFDIKRWIVVFLGALYLGLFMSYAINIRQLPNGREWLFTILVGGSATDVFSYLVGIKLGRTKLAPRTSPGKTWEGFAGGLIASVILVGLMLYYNYSPNLSGLLILPLLLLISFFAALGGGLILASINVKYRDVRYALPFFIQILLFVTPVIYPPSIAGQYSWILAINPMTGVIKGARGALLGTEPINWMLLGISFVAVTILSVIGIFIFKKTERYFADII